ncbi:MAG: T9SS type A sorting domain-containing protein [Bacteroidales bacterium]|nr:T9SS type A sorting domain-containing protein [Bacteroidales bacterium]
MKPFLQMKRVLRTAMLFLLMSIAGTGKASAQNLFYDFEQCNVGDKVAETLGEPWTTWNLNPGSTEDALISDEHCLGTRALKIDKGNDLVLKLGDKTSGAYNISFDMFIPEGREGYFNILHEFAGSNSTSFINVWFNNENNGDLINGLSMSYSNLDFPLDEWFKVNLEYYVDDGILCFKINDEIVCLGKSFHSDNYKLAALDLWASSQNEDRDGFFIDNVYFKEIEGPFVPNLSTLTNTIDVVLAKDTIDNTSYYCELENDGTAMIRFTSWIDYGVGEDGGAPISLHYDSDPYYYYGHYNDNPYIELGIRYFYYDLSETMMIGRKITGMQYYVPASFETGGAGPISFKIYKILGFGTILDTELIAEKKVYSYDCGSWLTVEFDEPIPLRGFSVFATVGFQQVGGGYPISMDAGPANQHKGDLVRINGGEWFSLNYYSIYYGDQEYGNHNIRLICEGQPVTAGWVTESYELWGEILCPGDNKTYELAFNTTGLDYGEYEALLHFEVNDHEDLELTIPINLKVGGTNVNEFTEDQYKVYPNPTNGQIKIEAEGLKHITISNMLGQVVYDGNASSDTFEYDFDKHNAGLYFIRIETTNGVTEKKITVE